MRALYVSTLALFVILFGYLFVLQASSRGVTVQPQVLASTITVVDPNENAIINQINTLRRGVGVPELSYNFGLKDLTNYRVDDMVSNQDYSHTTPEGHTYAYFMDAYSPDSTFSCENLQLQIGADSTSVVAAWAKSPAHNRCLLDPRVNKIAISYDIHSEVAVASSEVNNQMYVFAMIASN